MSSRKIVSISKSVPVMEGAGVHLRRAFGNAETHDFDPFLMLDDFRSDTPAHYLKGFPWHPHRGIETITYVLAGDVEHGDSLGNSGDISSGDVQWMTAGSGIVHQEMPKGDAKGRMYGFQLWTNLPAKQKMMDPRYRDVKAATIPEIEVEKGFKAKIVAGSIARTTGPVADIVTDPTYLDVSVSPGKAHSIPVAKGHTAVVYVFEGACSFGDGGDKKSADNCSLLLFGDGDEVVVRAESDSARFLFLAGNPIREPIAWRGPIVMNTWEEIEVAFEEYANGTFIKSRGK